MLIGLLGTNFSEINRNSYIFIQEDAFENVVCETAAILSRPQWINKPSQPLIQMACRVTDGMTIPNSYHPFRQTPETGAHKEDGLFSMLPLLTQPKMYSFYQQYTCVMPCKLMNSHKKLQIDILLCCSCLFTRIYAFYKQNALLPFYSLLCSHKSKITMNEITNPTWWRHLMETFSALLAICAGNSPVTGEFPAQRPVTRSFGVFFDLRLNEWLSKRWRGWWFETLSRPL